MSSEDRKHEEEQREEAATNNHQAAAHESTQTQQQQDYPVDENLFHSAPSQPTTSTTSPLDQQPPSDAPTDQEPTTTYLEPAPSTLLPPPTFTPLFTLLHDTTTNTHHHPTIHYLFRDSDPDPLTLAALDSISGFAEDEIEERCMIVDLSADGKSVVAAKSMSPEWMVLEAGLERAPSWEGKGEGLMLRVVGCRAGAGRGEGRERGGDVDALVREFGEGLDRLEAVVGDLGGDGEEEKADA